MERGQRSEVRGQKSGVRGQGSGVRSQGSGVRGQGAGVRGQASGVLGHRFPSREGKGASGTWGGLSLAFILFLLPFLLHAQTDTLETTLETIKLQGTGTTASQRSLRNVEGVAIYAAKKSEVIDLKNITANLATNNARQVYKGIAGLNIWENDGAGLQLSIGARGLDPNRTSNFNTRQNGYDISADALGYPESYYTPPTQALKRIEVVRGAASLQYGPQFGGLLNFVFKTGNEDKPFEFFTENTVGSFGLKTSFNSVGGTVKGLNYYSFYQRKQGKGWRPNSQFKQNTAYSNLTYSFSEKLKLSGEFTHMDYLAQQAGGLQDFEFQQDPRQSRRARNWFRVNWNLAAATLDYRISEHTKLNNRSFFLDAKREALGELGPINRPDPLRERDLIKGRYLNFGNETRLIHRYCFGNMPSKDMPPSTFLIGARYYQGYAHNMQGNGDEGEGPTFDFLNPDDLEQSDYEFPSRNISAFVENLFYLTPKWTVTPGVRFENIRTSSDGYFKQRVFSGGQVIFEQMLEDAKVNNRSLVLLGVGTGYKLNKQVEVYGNFSQNYRSINFTDLAVVNPNLVVDSLLKDERGFNVDAGIRGKIAKGAIRFDLTLFFLRYNDRIGIGEVTIPDPSVIEKTVAYRTNIGNADIKGLESYVEADLWKFFSKKENPQLSLTVFGNFSLIHGTYTDAAPAFKGNEVELIPPFSLKTGIQFAWKGLRASWQLARVGEHFSDATNAEFVSDATRGLIPTYQVQDLSTSYEIGRFGFQAGINNLTNSMYFTRRAAAYPGPGIIPAEGRSWYGGVNVRL